MKTNELVVGGNRIHHEKSCRCWEMLMELVEGFSQMEKRDSDDRSQGTTKEQDKDYSL